MAYRGATSPRSGGLPVWGRLRSEYRPLQTFYGVARASSGSVSKRLPSPRQRLGANAEAADCFYPVSRDRLTEVCRARGAGGEDTASDHLDRFVQYSCPSLAHFIALLCRPTRSSLPPDIALIVVDSLSALLNHAFPRLPAQKAAPKASGKGENPHVRPSSELC